MATHEFPAAAGIRHLTVSVGVAAWHPEDGGSEVVSRADETMYRVKATGGNGICVLEHWDHDRVTQGEGPRSAVG